MFTVVRVYDIFTIKIGSLVHHVTFGGGGGEGKGDGFSGHISGFQQFMIFL